MGLPIFGSKVRSTSFYERQEEHQIFLYIGVFDLPAMKFPHLLILGFAIQLLSCGQPENEEKIKAIEMPKEVDWSSMIGQDFYIDPQHSYVGFKIKYFGFSPVRGRFNDFDATAFYDGESPISLSVSMSIDVATINTGNERRDQDLTSEETWFDLPSFPRIEFQSQKIIMSPEG